MGGGGCDGPCEESAMEAPAATEEAFEYATEAATEAPAAAEEAPMNASPTSTPEALVDVQSLETEDAARVEQTAVTKEGGPESSAQDQTGESANQPEAQEEPDTPINWTVLFLVIALISGGAMWFIRFSAQRKWR
ncbi:MAG: hypothetical protein JNK32_04710, partial [Anaerolineales bacterium]|nr:hypothetical protein [Anaerolineales bacterium]